MNSVRCRMDGGSMADCHDCVSKESFDEVGGESVTFMVPNRKDVIFASEMAGASQPL